MKRLVVLLLGVIHYGALYALPLGNPAAATLYTDSLWSEVNSPDCCSPDFSWCTSWNVRLGFYGEYVFNRHMAVDKKGEPAVDKMELYTNAAYFVLNICERLDFFTTLGMTSMSIDTNLSPFVEDPINAKLAQFSFESAFSWSLGARAILWECSSWLIGIEGQYFRTNTDFTSLLQKVDNHFTYVDEHDVVYDEWQVGLALSYTFSLFCEKLALVPYMGVSWAESKLNLQGLQIENSTFNNLRSEKLWGYNVGTTFTLDNKIGVTVEGHFANEKALYVCGEFRF